MLRKLGIRVAYLLAGLYVLLIVWPAEYCYRTGCKGPGELDAFMPAFFLAPLGSIATAFSLRHSIKLIQRKDSWAWMLWPIVVIFAIVLLGTIAFLARMIYQTATHR